MNAKYKNFISKLESYAAGKVLPFTLTILDPLSNSFIGPIPSHAAELALQAEREGNR